jgi:hypothetical protein
MSASTVLYGANGLVGVVVGVGCYAVAVARALARRGARTVLVVVGITGGVYVAPVVLDSHVNFGAHQYRH